MPTRTPSLSASVARGLPFLSQIVDNESVHFTFRNLSTMGVQSLFTNLHVRANLAMDGAGRKEIMLFVISVKEVKKRHCDEYGGMGKGVELWSKLERERRESSKKRTVVARILDHLY